VGGLLVAGEVARQETARDDDPADQVPEGELKKGEVAAGPDARDGDHGEGRGLGGDDRKEHAPRRQVPGAEKIVARGALAPGDPEADAQRQDEVGEDDGEIDTAHASSLEKGGAKSEARSGVVGQRSSRVAIPYALVEGPPDRLQRASNVPRRVRLRP